MESSGELTPSSEARMPTLRSLTIRRPAQTPAQSISHFQTLLNLFSRQILPTSATQHIPFLLFLCSSFSHTHTDLFLGLLVSQSLYGTSTTSPTAASQRLSLTQRLAATVYIGSIVCRARFVSDDQARQVMAYLLAYIDGKLQQKRPAKSFEELPLFYAVCQASMLIFCFRWRAFSSEKESDSVLGEMEMDGESVDETGESKWMQDLEVLQRAIFSDLNPLLVNLLHFWDAGLMRGKGCNPTIVSTFAKVAHQTNFAYCFSIIDANQQSTHFQARSASSQSLAAPSRQYSQSSGPSLTLPRQARQFNVDAGMDSYFPFDPYDLPRSKRWIEGIYRTWDEVAIDSADESESESDNEESSADEKDSVGAHPRLKDTLSADQHFPLVTNGGYDDGRRRILRKDGGLSSSLEGMAISPNLSRLAC